MPNNNLFGAISLGRRKVSMFYIKHTKHVHYKKPEISEKIKQKKYIKYNIYIYKIQVLNIYIHLKDQLPQTNHCLLPTIFYT